jgi:hypothetical protein
MYRLGDLIKREYYLLISREGGSIVMTPGNSTYLLVPKEVREALKARYGIDFRKKKEMRVKCDMVEEQGGTVSLVYSFWNLEGGKEVSKADV